MTIHPHPLSSLCHCSLLTAHRLLLTPYFLLLSSYFLLLTSYCSPLAGLLSYWPGHPPVPFPGPNLPGRSVPPSHQGRDPSSAHDIARQGGLHDQHDTPTHGSYYRCIP